MYETVGPGGVGTVSPPLSDYVNQYSMDGSAAQTVAWPTGATFCNISAVSDYWVRSGGTAVVPAAGITNGTGSALNVAQRRRQEGELSFSIITSTAQKITVEFWGG